MKTEHILKVAILALLFNFASNCATLATEPTNDNVETKRIDMPFIHIGIRKHADGTKDVDVKAPLVKVHNPAGPDNAQVKAPFTKVDNPNSGTTTSDVKTSTTTSTTTSTQSKSSP